MSLRCDITEGVERLASTIDDECRTANIREIITVSIGLEWSLVPELLEESTTEILEESDTELIALGELHV